ncbi:MAG: DNA starvation/stationary phase protection protein Dps [Oscillatoriales cyanobacterium RM2_1_1]|nr:DNA starvation/stationary phase protection protein Dps [Oscillatoriales cyanobacterium SM2_3_0]NJO46854.1 DNA starvation/stationary phase protection protein Dps [Oscillatoriales cyanobacterium RM2_1_1]
MSTTSLKQKLYPSRIDLSTEIRQQVVALLNASLATTLDLKTQVKQAHWNVKGMNFYSLHELFDAIAGELEGYVDMVAERVTALGGLAMGTARVAAADSILPEYPFEITAGKDHLIALADRFAAYGSHVREAIDQTGQWGDADTADLYTEISRTVDMRLWFLEAHLQDGEAGVTNGSSTAAAQQAKVK